MTKFILELIFVTGETRHEIFYTNTAKIAMLCAKWKYGPTLDRIDSVGIEV